MAGQEIPTEYYGFHTEEKILINTLQYADDSKIYMDENQIPIFKQTMDLFASATGQHLNVEKTKLLPISKQLVIPTQIAGFTTTTKAQILGLTYDAWSGKASFDWRTKLETLENGVHKIITALPHSSFAKYQIWSSLGFTQLLYAAEFTLMTPSTMLKLHQITSKLLGNAGKTWSIAKLSSNPSQGGLACLPYWEHIRAKHNKWALALMIQGTTTLWTKVAWRTKLETLENSVHKIITALSKPFPQTLDLILWGNMHQTILFTLTNL